MVVSNEYPVQLGIAYLFLVGYLVRTLFVFMRLPASVGVILSGFTFSYFFQVDLLVARDLLQQLAFFLVLLTAGLEISLKDLRPYIFVMALLPASMEVLGITLYAVHVMEWALIEGLVLGTVLVAIGDGLVIPKMKEFGMQFKGHPMPKLIFTWAPLEASYVLALFGILTGLSAPAGQGEVNIAALVFANVFRIVATLGVAAALGAASGWLIPRRTELVITGRHVFTGSSVEAFLMVLAVALVAYGLGEGSGGHAFVPMGFSSGSMFQPELLVIVTGTFFSHFAEKKVLHDVEGILGGVWVFGQLILFSMLGSRTSTSILPSLPSIIPVIASGLLFRCIGVFLATFLTLPYRGCDCNACTQRRRETALQDGLFCFLSTLPRATIQGALGGVPLAERFFQNIVHKHRAQEFTFTAAKLYIVCLSVVGMTLLNIIGLRILKDTSDRAECEKATLPGTPTNRLSGDGSPACSGGDASPGASTAGGLLSPDAALAAHDIALELLGQRYGLPAEEVQKVLEGRLKAAATDASPSAQARLFSLDRGEAADVDQPMSFERVCSAPDTLMLSTFKTKVKSRRSTSRKTWRNADLALCQFEQMGDMVRTPRPKVVEASGSEDTDLDHLIAAKARLSSKDGAGHVTSSTGSTGSWGQFASWVSRGGRGSSAPGQSSGSFQRLALAPEGEDPPL